MEAVTVLGVGDGSFLEAFTDGFGSRDGYSVVTRRTAEEAAARIREDDVDCVVTDLVLDDGDGIGLLETVREEREGLPVVVVTARGSEEAASRAIGAGTTDYVRLTDDPELWEVLARRLESYVERHRLEREQRESEEYRRRLYEITSDPERTPREKVRSIMTLGTERLAVDNAVLSYIRPDVGSYHVAEAVGPGVEETVGEEFRLGEVYCRAVIDSDEILGWRNLRESWREDPAQEAFDWGCYLGAKLEVGGELFGTICFSDMQPRDRAFSHAEKAFVDTVGRWASYELQEKPVDPWTEEWRGRRNGG